MPSDQRPPRPLCPPPPTPPHTLLLPSPVLLLLLQVRGVSHEGVTERERPKSMLAAKSFNPTSDLAAIEGWFRWVGGS